MDLGTSVRLYKSLVLPHFDYCDLAYSCEANLQKLQKLQNSACRTLLRADRRAHIKDMHNELKLLTLSQRRELHLSVECFKQVNNSQSSLNHYFVPAETRHTCTGGKKVKVPDIKSATGRKGFSYRGPVYWNKVSEDLKNCESINSFKVSCLDQILRDVNHPT